MKKSTLIQFYVYWLEWMLTPPAKDPAALAAGCVVVSLSWRVLNCPFYGLPPTLYGGAEHERDGAVAQRHSPLYCILMRSVPQSFPGCAYTFCTVGCSGVSVRCFQYCPASCLSYGETDFNHCDTPVYSSIRLISCHTCLLLFASCKCLLPMLHGSCFPNRNRSGNQSVQTSLTRVARLTKLCTPSIQSVQRSLSSFLHSLLSQSHLASDGVSVMYRHAASTPFRLFFRIFF